MDALILASALTEPECTTFVTTDTTLLMNSDILELVEEWRSNNDMHELKIVDVNAIFR